MSSYFADDPAGVLELLHVFHRRKPVSQHTIDLETGAPEDLLRAMLQMFP